jgi:hypothetical protein
MKYESLNAHLRDASAEIVPLSFTDIEHLIGAKLPPSARKHSAWWSNNPTGHVNAQAWLGAGYRAESVDLQGEKLVFRREQTRANAKRRVGPHPAFGAMKGTVTIPAGVDLTEPADPDWGKVYE